MFSRKLILLIFVFGMLSGVSANNKSTYVVQYHGEPLTVDQNPDVFGLELDRKTGQNYYHKTQRLKNQYIQMRYNVKIDNTYQNVLNGFSVETTQDKIEDIGNDPLIKKTEISHSFGDAETAFTADEYNNSIENAYRIMNVYKTWDLVDSQGRNLTGQDVHIGILGMGVDFSHKEFGDICQNETWRQNGNCKRFTGNGYDFVNDDNTIEDADGHGTAVNGLVNADFNNYTGVAPNSSVSHYKVYDGLVNYDDWLAGFDQAAEDGADIVTASIGVGPNLGMDFLNESVRNARENGTLYFNSAGNERDYDDLTYAGSEVETVTLGMTVNDNTIQYTSRGVSWFEENSTILSAMEPEYTAPGAYIMLQPNDDYYEEDGTSFSTPVTASIAGLILQKYPSLTPDDLEAILGNSARINRKMINKSNISKDEYDHYHFRDRGAGIVDAYDSARQEGILKPFYREKYPNDGTAVANYTLYNHRDYEVTYDISYSSNSTLMPYIPDEDYNQTLNSISHNQVTLGPGETQEIQVNVTSTKFSVSRGKLNITTDNGPSFKGILLVLNQNDYGVDNSPRKVEPGEEVEFKYEDKPYIVMEYGQPNGSQISSRQTEVDLQLDNGTYLKRGDDHNQTNYNHYRFNYTIPQWLEDDLSNDLTLTWDLLNIPDPKGADDNYYDSVRSVDININVTDVYEPSVYINSITENGDKTYIYTNATAFDSFNLTDVNIWVNGTKYDMNNQNGDYYDKNVTGLSEGEYEVNVTAYDTFRVTNTTDSVYLGETPTLSDNYTESGYISEQEVFVQLDSTPNRKAQTINYTLDGSESSVSAEKTTFSVSGDGNHSISYFGINDIGPGITYNEYVALDSTPPNIDYNAETTNSGEQNQSWIYVSGSGSDNIGLKDISIQSPNFTETLNNNSGNFENNYTNLDDGYYEFKMFSEDKAGNLRGTNERQITLNTTIINNTDSTDDSDDSDSDDGGGGSTGSSGGGGSAPVDDSFNTIGINNSFDDNGDDGSSTAVYGVIAISSIPIILFIMSVV